MSESFTSLGQFALRLLAADVAIQVQAHRALHKVGKIVEDEAKDEIGRYQDAIGPYPAWAPLAPATEERKAQMGYPADAPLLATGQMRDNITHEVAGPEVVIGSPDERALYHEVGTDKMPPRPVFGPAAYKSRGAIEKAFGEAIMAGLLNGKQVKLLP